MRVIVNSIRTSFRYLIIKVNITVVFKQLFLIANKYLELLDNEDEVEVVEDNYQQFKEMYHPIWKSSFSNVFSLENGKIEINHDNATRKYLISHLNDNVLQNIKEMSIVMYDKDIKYHKSSFDTLKKKDAIEKIVLNNDIDGQNKVINRALDKILIAHRNSKLFLFMMTGPFFILAKFIWYIIKFGLIFLIFKKGKSKISDPVDKSQSPVAAT